MSYTVNPYLLKIADLEKIVGSQDRDMMVKILKNKAAQDGEKFDESELDFVEETNSYYDQDDDEENWNTVAAVRAIVNGDLNNKQILGHQYGYALEAICMYFGKHEPVEALESVRGSWTFEEMWGWILDSKSPVPLPDQGDNYPYIGYLRLDEIQKELDRTERLNFNVHDEDDQEMYTEIREGLVELYKKALDKKLDIVTFYY